MSELMWEQGYSATSPRKVREVSGVGQGSMYHFFPSKKDLGLAALERNCATIETNTIASVGITDPLEALVAHIERPRPALKGCRVGRMTQDKTVMADDELRAPVERAFLKAHEDLVAVIRHAQELGELSASLVSDELADTISATIQGAYVLAIAQQDERPYRAACDGLVSLLRTFASESEPAKTADGGISATVDTQIPAAVADKDTYASFGTQTNTAHNTKE